MGGMRDKRQEPGKGREEQVRPRRPEQDLVHPDPVHPQPVQPDPARPARGPGGERGGEDAERERDRKRRGAGGLFPEERDPRGEDA